VILITGVNGFVGHHLAKACFDSGEKVVGVGYGQLDKSSKLNDLLDQYLSVDMTDSAKVNESISFENINIVFHLASLAAVGPSYDQPARYIADNPSMLINLAEKALQQKSQARFVVVSSGAIYDPLQPLPIKEDGKLLPNSPYAVSKIATELMCEYYRGRGLDMVVVRPFNHIGPGQMPGFILPDLELQAHHYSEKGKFSVGNLKTKRDYTDVRDVVQAYIALGTADKLKHNLYNICSGQSHSGEFILNQVCKNLNIKEPIVETDQDKIRPSDIMDIRGDNSLIKADTGWSPQIPIEKSIKDFLGR
jgi:GDP-4-dehydro-6-deoxy-D-mannose reductase